MAERVQIDQNRYADDGSGEYQRGDGEVAVGLADCEGVTPQRKRVEFLSPHGKL